MVPLTMLITAQQQKEYQQYRCVIGQVHFAVLCEYAQANQCGYQQFIPISKHVSISPF